MKTFFFIIGLIGAGFLAYNYAPEAAQRIENNVTENITAKLVPQGLPADVKIEVDGREVILSGFVDKEEDKTNFANLAKSTEGVRTVSTDLDVPLQSSVTVHEIQEPIDILSNDIPFDPLGDEPLFEEVEEEVEETVVAVNETVQETVEEVVPEINEVVEETQNIVEEVSEETTDMIEEPAIQAPEDADLMDAVEEVSEEMPELVEAETKKTAVECQADISALVAGKRINFETGQTKFDRDSVPLLDSLVEQMEGCADMAIHIHGHTDNVGDPTANRKISHARAKSVGLYLLKEGVTQRIKIFGHGPDQPIASNDTEEGREANRRIEFTVTDFDDSVETDDPRTVKTKKVPSAIREHTIIVD